MKNLEKNLENVERKREKARLFVEKPLYQGFKLIEEKVYAGPTSIMYWM